MHFHRITHPFLKDVHSPYHLHLPSHFLLSEVISKRTTFSQPSLPPTDVPANALILLRYRRYINQAYSEYKHVLANILRSRYVARTPPLEARSPGRRGNVENASVTRRSLISNVRTPRVN